MPKPLNIGVMPQVKAFTDVEVIERWRTENASTQAFNR